MVKMEGILTIFSFLAGICLGSFANVCIYRLPRRLSIVNPPSFCPSCKHPIKWYHNIPILSYILLKGRCHYCGEKISPLYPLVELTCGILSVMCLKKFGITPDFLIFLLFSIGMIMVFFIDLQHYIIPNAITFTGIGAGLLLLLFYPPLPRKEMLAGALLGGGLFGGVSLFYYLLTGKVGLGEGDIKLMIMMGFFTGLKGVLFITLLGGTSGALIGSFYLLLQKKGMRSPIPFGPFLSASALLFLFFPQKALKILFPFWN